VSTRAGKQAPRVFDDRDRDVTELAIRASGLEKSFGSVHALAGVELEVPRGSAFGFIGENGAGKTTFIKILLGVARASAGEVSVLGGTPDDVNVRKHIGYLPERLELPPAFSPIRFLRGVGRLKGMSRAELDDQIPRTLERVGLAQSAWARKTKGFSKGMRQRTGLAAALIGRPQLLVLDEPTDGIDPVGRARIRDVIAEAKRDGATIFLNSHLLAETEKICDHVAIISRGKVRTSGAIESLRSQDAYRVVFEKADDLDERAKRHGFMPDAEAREAGHPTAFRLAGADANALSGALQSALGDGLLVTEVTRALKDLEAVLEEALNEAKP
jgi:ABC-2 type transport system ATP-binding protein